VRVQEHDRKLGFVFGSRPLSPDNAQIGAEILNELTQRYPKTRARADLEEMLGKQGTALYCGKARPLRKWNRRATGAFRTRRVRGERLNAPLTSVVRAGSTFEMDNDKILAGMEHPGRGESHRGTRMRWAVVMPFVNACESNFRMGIPGRHAIGRRGGLESIEDGAKPCGEG